jgi:hypothetical protein
MLNHHKAGLAELVEENSQHRTEDKESIQYPTLNNQYPK